MKKFNILDYGAKMCDALQTNAIQAAIDDCFLAGGGRVVIPCGVFYTGSIRIRSNVELYLQTGAILKGSRDPEQYFGYRQDTLEPVALEECGDYLSDTKKAVSASCVATSRWSNGLIRAIDAQNIAVTGEVGSYIDGCNCYDPQGEQQYRGPHGMSIWRCRGIRLTGYTFLNSSNWCHAIFQSKDITIQGIGIHGGCDGIDIRTCDNVLIEDCNINSGDDCVAGFDNHDVIIRNCTLNTACMPFRLSGNNILAENCVSKDRNFGSRRWMTDEEKSRGELTNEKNRHESHATYSCYCDYRAVIRKPLENITIRNCHFAQEHEILRIEYDGRHRFCVNRGLRSITFEDCSMADIIDTGMIWGKADEKVSVYLKNVKVTCRPGHEHVPLFVADHFDRIVLENCTFEGYAEPTILVGDEDPGVIEVTGGTPVKLQKATKEECFKAHPGGIHSGDWGKNLCNFF